MSRNLRTQACEGCPLSLLQTRPGKPSPMALPHRVLQEWGTPSSYLCGAGIPPECHADGQGEPLHGACMPRGTSAPHPKSQPTALHCTASNKLLVQFQTKPGCREKQSALGPEFLLFLLPEIEKRMSVLHFSAINSFMKPFLPFNQVHLEVENTPSTGNVLK